MASYSSTVTYQSNNGGDYVKLKLDWSYTNTATTATISATLSICRDSYGPTMGNASYWVKVNNTEIFNSSTTNLTVGTSWVTVKSGSKTINLNSSGAQATNLSMTAYYNQPISEKLAGLTMANNASTWTYYNFTQAIQSGALTATIPAQASACTAPTTVSVSPNTFVSPTGTITISWSGAKSGTNNSITGYRVYYNIGSAPTASTSTYVDVSVSGAATSGSKSITLNLATSNRGKTLYTGVRTLCSNSSYWSGVKAQGTVIINSLPGKPTLKTETTTITDRTDIILASTSDGIDVTATAGSDNDTGQTYSVYYASTTTGTKTKYSSDIRFNPSKGSSETKYFWTYDGLEFSSSYSTLKVSKNVTPTISTANITGTLCTAKGSSDTYYKSVTFGSFTSNFTNGKYTIERKVDSGSWSSIYSNQSFDKATFTPNKSYSLDSALSSSIENDSTFSFRIKITVDCYGGTENSAWREYSSSYKYPGRFSVSSDSPGLPGFSFNIQEDSSITSWTVTASDSTYIKNVSSSLKNTITRTFSIESKKDPEGSTLTFTIIGYTPNGKQKINTFDYTVRKKTKFTSLSTSTLNAFNDSQSSFTLKAAGVWGTDIESFPIQFNIVAMKNNNTVSFDSDPITQSGSSFSDLGLKTITINDLLGSEYSASEGLKIPKTQYVGTVDYNLSINYENKYGEKITISKDNNLINFDKDPDSLSLTSIEYKNSNNGTYNNINSHYFQEGQTIKLTYSFNNYSYKSVTVEAYILLKNSAAATNNTGTKIFTKTIAANVDNVGTNYNKPETVSDTIEYTLGELQNTKCYFKIIIKQYTESLPTNWLDGDAAGALKMFTPTGLNFESIVPDEDNNKYIVQYSYTNINTLTNNTSPPSITKKLYLQYNNAGTWANFSSLNVTTASASSSTANFSGSLLQTTNAFRLRLYTAVAASDNYISNSRYAISSEKIVYVDQPLVSYRKNQLGINNKSPDPYAVLDIATTSGKEQLFIRKGGTVMLKITFNNSDTTIFDIP